MRVYKGAPKADIKLLRRLFAGLAAGDSLGSSTEFMPQKEVPECYRRLKAKWMALLPGGQPSPGPGSGLAHR